MFGRTIREELPTAEEALIGRKEPMPVATNHLITGAAMVPPFAGCEIAVFGMGCFWGAERLFWEHEGVKSTQSGYAGGHTENPTYEEVCSGMTAHVEVVRVVYDPKKVSYDQLLKTFFENHDPTQGMRQGSDLGTQYRSAIYATNDAQLRKAKAAKAAYQAVLNKEGYGEISTEVAKSGPFYLAEDYHQQYLAKNPNAYCGLEGVGVGCPIGLAKRSR